MCEKLSRQEERNRVSGANVMNCIIVRMIALLGLVFATAANLALAQDAKPDPLVLELMRKSGADFQVEKSGREMQAVLDKSGEKDAQALGVTVDELRTAASRALDFRAMADLITLRMARELSRAEVQTLLDWFNSPIGGKSVALLQAAKPEEAARMLQTNPGVLGNPRRIAIARMMIDSMLGAEGMMDIVIELQLMGPTIAAAFDTSLEPGLVALREGLGMQRPVLRDTLQMAAAIGVLYAYRSLSDEEIERIAAFAGTPVARKYYQILNSASLHAVREAVATMGLALARSPSRSTKTPGQSMGLSVQRSGNTTNISISSLTLSAQNLLFGVIRKLPASQDEAVIAWAQRHERHLTPVFLFEMARRLWDKNHEEAFEWYALASIRARYDAMRCTDSSAPQGVLMLPQAAQNVLEGIEKERKLFGTAGLRALAQPRAFTSSVSPWWICSHGMGAINAAINKKPLENWLTVESSWDEAKEKIRRDMGTYYEEQGKPQDDPIAMTKRTFTVATLPPGTYDKFVWLDSNLLVVAPLEKGADGKFIRTLRTWSRDGTTQDIASQTGALSWCAGNGNVYYQTASPQKQQDGRMKLSYALGVPRQPVESSLVAKGFFQHAQQGNDGSLNWSRPNNAWRQSPLDCRWVESDRLSGIDSLSTWIPLLPGHGFLRLRAGETLTADDRLQYFASETSDPVSLPIRAAAVSAPAIGYFPYKGAYFISQSFRQKSADEVRISACVWWLTPGNGKTEEICLPADPIKHQAVSFAPSRPGILRRIWQRNTAHGPKPGGIYLTTGDGRSEKILEAAVRDWAVSPDGCAVAARDGAQVKVVELCR